MSADVPIREYYKVYNSKRVYIGNLPTPSSPLKISQDINNLGSQITIDVPVSSDKAPTKSDIYTAEDGVTAYTDESGSVNYITGAAAPITSTLFQGIDTLIKNGNIVECWISNYWYPNGKRMFTGKIRRWDANYGGTTGASDSIKITLYSLSTDMDNYLVSGTHPVLDQSQTSTDGDQPLSEPGGSTFAPFTFRLAQPYTVGNNVKNISGFDLKLKSNSASYPQTFTLSLYASASDAINGIAPLTQVSVVQASTTLTNTSFVFTTPLLVTQSTYFFTIKASNNYYFGGTAGSGGGTIATYSGGYAGGVMYTYFVDGSGHVQNWSPDTPYSLYFKSYTSVTDTNVPYLSKDPTIGMLEPILTSYNVRGGNVTWTALTIDATGLTLSYTFNVQTVNEALKAILSLAPDGFYYYIDLGNQIIYFKNQNTSADFLLQKGVHINALSLAVTTEASVNMVLVTGGDTGSGVNLYKVYTDNASTAALGPLLDRKSDNRVTLDATANAIGESELAQLSGEQNQSTVTIAHSTKIDITLLVPGKTIGFRGYGTFVDTIITQIVRWEWSAESVTLTLGTLPKRLTDEYENTTRQLIAQQTQDNPTTPT